MARAASSLRRNALVGAAITVGSTLVENANRNGVDWRGVQKGFSDSKVWGSLVMGTFGATVGAMIPGGRILTTLSSIALGSAGARVGGGEMLDVGRTMAGAVVATAFSLALAPLGPVGMIAGGIVGNLIGESLHDWWRRRSTPRIVRPLRAPGGTVAISGSSQERASIELLRVHSAREPVSSHIR